MKIRIVYRIDKSVAIIYPAPKSRRPSELEEHWLERVFNKATQGDLNGLPYDDVDSSELPQSREYREAWEGEKDTGIVVNQEKVEALKTIRNRKALIEAEKERLLEEQAITNLKAEGKL